eukprot:166879-Prymnesium_polylepis.1
MNSNRTIEAERRAQGDGAGVAGARVARSGVAGMWGAGFSSLVRRVGWRWQGRGAPPPRRRTG